MVFAEKDTKKNELDNIDTGLIDVELLQILQDQFCRTNGIYLVCLGKSEGVITKAYGTKEEQNFLHSIVDKSMYMQLVSKLEQDPVENMREHPMTEEYVKVCGTSTRIEGKTQVIWVVIGIIEEKVPENVMIPEYMQVTSEERYYRTIEFLELLTRQLFAVKLSEIIAADAMHRSEESEAEMQDQLHRLEGMMEVVRQLESDNGFAKIVDDSIREVCESLNISGGYLLRENQDDRTVDMICEYTRNKEWSALQRFQQISMEDIPFFNGKTYMISYDSIMPENLARFFEEQGYKAAVFEPIEVNDKAAMYLCFYEMEENRIWSVDDIKFLNDIKRVVQTILSKRIAKNSLASSYASLEAILENAGCGIYVADMRKRSILYTNHRFKELFSNTIRNGKLNDFVFSDKEVDSSYYVEEIYSPEEERWLDIHKTQIQWVDGASVSLCTIYDVTDRKIYQKKIETQANNDFLTGLFNRMRCEQDMNIYIENAKKAGKEGALLYMDLDDFKHINDGLGHQYGDVLLKAISHSLRRIPGIEQTCYRMGGDEFIVIVPHTQFDKLDYICQEIHSIFTKPWFLKGEDYYCTVSIGVAKFPTEADNSEELVRKADMALFAAKKSGKNHIEFYNDKNEMNPYHRLDMEKNMRSATLNECKEFEVYYQPIMDVANNESVCCGAEALVRWNSNVMGFVQPNDFIPLAEYLGLISPIGEYVLLQAAKRCKYWNDMGHPNYKVNVNLSVVQLLQNDIVKKIKKVLETTRVNPKNLTLEVTESLAINDMDRMKTILSEIKALGVKVALDDFGTGYSSLNHIREMPIDVIKIDRCFIEHLGEDDFSDAFVKMVSELATTIGVKVCVEGVENTRQLDALKNMKIRLIQGYYFGRPMPLKDFEAQYLV